MIRIDRELLPDSLTEELGRLTDEIKTVEITGRSTHARKLWRHTTVRRRVRAPLTTTLRNMAVGREFCMYCGDNRGVDIDHFEPLVRNPLRTFDWLNHLLACSGCNSGRKGDRFPIDADGRPLLIDPSAEDPFDHLRLTLSLGVYTALTRKGEVTIEVCNLNSENLTRGRQSAKFVVEACVLRWAEADEQGKGEWINTIQAQPFADVCQAMLRFADLPNAILLLETPRLIEGLRSPELRKTLLR